jgi:hypothetical protein
MQPYSTRQQRICMDGLEENTDIRKHPLFADQRWLSDW